MAAYELDIDSWLDNQIRATTNTQVRIAGNKLIASIRRKTPEITGNLKDGWEVEFYTGPDGLLAARVVNTVDYATFVNDGTSNQRAQRMVERAMDEVSLVTRIRRGNR